MKEPSKDWKENVLEDEEKRYNEYAQKIVSIQQKKSKLFGNGRALHRKQICGLKAKLEVLDNLPEYAKQGLFKKPATYDALIRISNGGVDIKSDKIPDIRGFSIKVLGLDFPSALGNGNTQNQDYTLINQKAFSFPKATAFLDLVLAISESPIKLLTHMIKNYGILGGMQRMIKMTETLAKPFSGFLTETFYSAAPIACGAYATRVRLKPTLASSNTASANSDFAKDIKSVLEKEDVIFELQLQFFVEENSTPIEDASVDWSEEISPYITVAKLIIPKQNIDSEEGKTISSNTEKIFFDPWNALLEHRPLGDVMRARKYIYYASQKERGANK